jgi:3-dehydroquinate synthase
MVDLQSSRNSLELMKIKSYKGEYEINFTDDFIASLNGVVQEGDVLLFDAKVSELYGNRFSAFEKTNTFIVIPSGERSKSFDAAKELIEKLMEIGFKRNHRLIAIGGGIIQDAVAFVASILFRGVEWFFVPTTLLAQGDSCIGSKTSVNFGNCKNLLGGFHPPSKIYIDSVFLDTLVEEEVRSGLGEMLHFFMISGRQDFELFRDIFRDNFKDSKSIKRLTQRSLAIKKEIIERDEFDQGPRKVFNFGHSFGHALEGITNYQIPHGIAVSYGMDIANNVSVYLGLMEEHICFESRELLSDIWRGTDFPQINIKHYMDLLSKDKKNVGKKLNLILSRGFGDMLMHEVSPDLEFVSVVDQCMKGYFEETV